MSPGLSKFIICLPRSSSQVQEAIHSAARSLGPTGPVQDAAAWDLELREYLFSGFRLGCMRKVAAGSAKVCCPTTAVSLTAGKWLGSSSPLSPGLGFRPYLAGTPWHGHLTPLHGTPGPGLREGQGHCPSLPLRSTWCSVQSRRSVASIVQFPLAQTGEGISECELVEWFVKEGDMVEEFDCLCQVQSDKASIEITSRYSGRVVKLHHKTGDVVKVGAILVDIEVEGGAVESAPTSSAAAPTCIAATSAPTCTAATSAPPAVECSKPALTATIATTTTTNNNSSSSSSSNDKNRAGAKPPGPVLAVPAVRQLAKELNADLAMIMGSGSQGRITKEDVQRYIQAACTTLDRPAGPSSSQPHPMPSSCSSSSSSSSQPHQTASGSWPAPFAGKESRVPLRGFRRAMVKSMTAVSSIPHFHYSDEFLMDPLMKIRQALKDDARLLSGSGTTQVKLTLLPFLIKALSSALLSHPTVNSSLSPDGDELLLHGSHNIGVAMATQHGLVVPNIKDVQSRSVSEVALELGRLQAAAMANKLASADVQGGSITVSNIGSIGGIYASPLVNAPEVAIVALGRVRLLPRYDAQGAIVPRSLMGVSWGADHRVVDGASLALFCNEWKALVEEPTRLLMSLR